jgi:cytoskeletal protein CcmA (bactofilin family)
MFKRQKQEPVQHFDKKKLTHGMKSSSEDNGLFVNSVNKFIDSEKPSVISEGCSIEGSVTSDGVLLLEGIINGSVSAVKLSIGRYGRMHGQVRCKTLSIMGVFAGQAKCEDLYVASSANLEGDISYQKIQVERGAVILGELMNKNNK